MGKSLAILLLMNIIFKFVAHADINEISTDSVLLDNVSTNYDRNTLKKLDIDSIEIELIGGYFGEVKIYQDFFTIPSYGLRKMPYNKYKITRAIVDSVVCPIDSLFIRRCVPIRVGYEDLGLPKGAMISGDGLFIKYRIFYHNGRTVEDMEHLPPYTLRKKIIYSKEVEKLTDFFNKLNQYIMENLNSGENV
ncbi:MAG: hypothetical protein K2M07_05125 [Muribaculaceae bacterium]|nr:hypothetical protein [Muribaculaceae bacterium]